MAYAMARRRGFKGTLAEWLISARVGPARQKGDRGDRGADGGQGERGLPGDSVKGDRGGRGQRGEKGEAGLDGFNGWTPLPALVHDGERRIMQIVGWVGGTGPKPQAKLYVGPDGLTERIDEATDLRGPRGYEGRGVIIGGGGSGVTLTQVMALIEANTMEDFDQIPLDDQTNSGGSPAVLVFTFASDVHKVWVKLLAASLSDTAAGRARTDGVDPDVDTGQPLDAGVPQPISAVTSEVRVYTPAGKTVSVTGYRRRT